MRVGQRLRVVVEVEARQLSAREAATVFPSALGGPLAEAYGVRAVFAVGGVASLALLVVYAVTVRPGALDMIRSH